MLRRRRILHLLLAGAGLGLTLTLFRPWVLLLTNLPVPGSLDWSHPLVVAAFFSDGMISLGSLVGYLTVLGIAARNGIMLISHYQHLEQVDGVPFGSEVVVQGTKERLAPVLMTGVTTGLSLIPLIIYGNIPGHEIEHPTPIVILGSLVTSTLLNLFVVPALYLRLGRSQPRVQAA